MPLGVNLVFPVPDSLEYGQRVPVRREGVGTGQELVALQRRLCLVKGGRIVGRDDDLESMSC